MATKHKSAKKNNGAGNSQESKNNTDITQFETSPSKDLSASKEVSNTAKPNLRSPEVLVPNDDWVHVPAKYFISIYIEYDRSCRRYPPEVMEASVQYMLYNITKPREVIIYTDGSVRAGRSGWAFTAEVGGWIVNEDAGGLAVALDSTTMEIMAVTKAMEWLAKTKYTRVSILSDSLNMIKKIQYGWFRSKWVEILQKSRVRSFSFIFVPSHAGVIGNERADSLAGWATVEE